MPKYIELIDKYRIDQSQEGSYNPPNYIWVDNIGEIIRCKDCDNWNPNRKRGVSAPCDEWSDIEHGMTRYTLEDDFCSYAERRDIVNES